MNRVNKKFLEFLGLEDENTLKIVIVLEGKKLPKIRVTKILNDGSLKTVRQGVQLVDEEVSDELPRHTTD
jgi:hypothetical protein